MAKQTAEQRKRSEAAKKAAETRRQNAEAAKAEEAQQTQGAGDDSQQEPDRDSGLQTPQPDQPIPTTPEPTPDPAEEPRRTEDESADQDAEPEPVTSDQLPDAPQARLNVRADVKRSDGEQVALHVQQELEREEAIREHNRRTGGGKVEEAERLVAKAQHLQRTDPVAASAFVRQLTSVG